MSAWSMRARLVGLLTAVVAAVLLATLFAVRQATAEPGVEQLARMIEAEVRLVERASAPPTDVPGLALAQTPPAAIAQPQLRFTRDLLARLTERFGAGRVRLGGAPLRVWVRADAAPLPWVGVEIDPFLARMRRAFWFVMLSSAAVVLLAAGWFARRLTRPLEALAAAAPRLIAGESVAIATATPEIAALAQALERAAADKRAALEARERALAEVSHDLRTPLARLRFALELGDDARPAQRAAMIADVEELDAIVGDALAWLRDGREEPIVEVDLDALVREVAGAFARRAGDPIAVESTATRIRGKRVALRRALSNLIDNALRHGGAPVAIEVAPADGIVRIVVRDAGRGADGEAKGYGLGLGIVRAVAAAHGGDVAARAGEVVLTIRR